MNERLQAEIQAAFPFFVKSSEENFEDNIGIMMDHFGSYRFVRYDITTDKFVLVSESPWDNCFPNFYFETEEYATMGKLLLK
jgi:hypothetical protein